MLNCFKKNLILRTITLACIIFAHYAHAAQKPHTPLQSLPPAEQGHLLGWEQTPTPDLPLCPGYFKEPKSIHQATLSNIKTAALTITSAHESHALRQGTSIIEGGVRVSQPGRLIEADQLTLHQDKAGKLASLTLQGHVRLYEPGRMIIAQRITVYPRSITGDAMEVLYRVQKTPRSPLVGWGHGKKLKILSRDTFSLYAGSYSTCAPTTTGWQLHGNTINIDQTTGRGQAWNTWLKIDNTPVLYFPYINFPIDHRRKSGFLMPAIGRSNVNGNILSTPIYWHIAPQADATFTPRWLENRGLEANTLWRYLSYHGDSMLNLHWLPDDKRFQDFKNSAATTYGDNATTNHYLHQLDHTSKSRYFIELHNHHQWTPHFDTDLTINQVSDAYYFQDMDSPNYDENITELPSQFSANFQQSHWRTSLLWATTQTLHAINRQTLTDPYRQTPTFTFDADWPNEKLLAQLSLNASFSNFTTPNDFITGAPQLEGKRIIFTPTLEKNMNNVMRRLFKAPISFDASVSASNTFYNLNNQAAGSDPKPQRHLPIVNLDAQTQLARDLEVFGKHYQQTLEPRIYYLYVPYKSQDNLPNFDTNLPSFDTNLLFVKNRFTGSDRISNANQVSLGLTTRLLQSADRTEKFNATVGGIVYFADRKVCLTSACSDPNEQLRTEHFSPIAASLRYALNPHWDINSNIAYEFAKNQTQNSLTQFTYHRDDDHLFDVGYEFVRGGDPYPVATVNSDNPKQDLYRVKTGLYWPIKNQWHALGSWHYNISHQFLESYFAGLEYRSCCWGMRVLLHRTLLFEERDGDTQYDSQIMFQLSLKGLSTMNHNNTHRHLVNGIEHFHDHLGDNQ